MSLKESLRRFYEFCLFEKGLAEASASAYISDINIFFEFIASEDIKNLNEVSFKIFLRFLEQRKKIDRLSERSLVRFVSSFKTFFLFLERDGVIRRSFIHDIHPMRSRKHIPYAPDKKSVADLLNNLSKNTPSEYRDYLLIKLLYALGLRVSEVLRLKIGDVCFDAKTVQILGKGEKMRIVPFYEDLGFEIKKYLSEFRSFFVKEVSSDFLFLNRFGKKMSRIMLWKIVSKRANTKILSNEKRLSPHSFRHGFASHLVQEGADIRTVQELLGHSNVKTTEQYTHLFCEDLKRAFEEYHPFYEEA